MWEVLGVFLIKIVGAVAGIIILALDDQKNKPKRVK